MGERNFFESINSKSAFWLGVAGGLGVMFALGFFIILGLYTNSGSLFKATNSTNKAAAAPTVPTDPTQPTAPAAVATPPAVAEDDHATGPANAKITVIEFSDIQCPFCQRFHPTLQQLMAEYPNDIKWVYKHFPLSSIHPNAQSAAEASECAAEQLGDEGFFDYLEALFAKQTLLGRDLYIAEAVNLGAKEKQFTDCFDQGKYKSVVSEDYQQGIAAGVQGTPTSFINDREIPGALPYDQVKAVVDSLLNS